MNIFQTNIDCFPCRRGKVRDVYDIGKDRLVIVSTDRISVFDLVIPNTTIPNKGRILTGLTFFWLNFIKEIVPNHFLTDNIEEMPEPFHDEEVFAGRTMMVQKANVVPVECIVRGFLSGSGFQDYEKNGSVCGVKLPPGMKESMPLAGPLFTPSTKAEQGHDENISVAAAIEHVGNRRLVEAMADTACEIYRKTAEHCWSKGLILADTKMEFGLAGDHADITRNMLLIDELLTPDSSRYWPFADYCVGCSPPSLDKQYVRDYYRTSGWDRKSPLTPLPEDVVNKTAAKYAELFRAITGVPFAWGGHADV